MMRILSSLSAALALLALPVTLLVATPNVAAVDVFPVCTVTANTTDVCESVPDHGTAGENPIIKALKLTIEVLSLIIGITAVIMIIVGGLWFITANGDPQAIGRARSTVIYALIGLAVAAFAQIIVSFVIGKL